MVSRELLDSLASAKGAKFAAFTYRAKGTGELAKHLVTLGVSIERMYEKDIAVVEAMLPTLSGIDLEAANAVLASLRESVEKGIGNNSKNVHGSDNADTYIRTEVPNVVINKNDGVFHLRNVVSRGKTVIEAGTPKKPVNSKPLTIAKDKIRNSLRINSIRQFALEGISVAKLNGDTLELG